MMSTRQESRYNQRQMDDFMDNLSGRKCVPCEGKAKPLTREQIAPLLTQVPEWKVASDDAEAPRSPLKLRRDFAFENFQEAMGFANEVGDIAEFEGHHPDLLIHGWNKAEVTFFTHAIKGLSENDFIMAAKVDQLLRERKA